MVIMKSISSQQHKKHTSRAQPDLSKILEPCENQWVALSPDYTHVVASGETLKDVHAKVPEDDREHVVFHKVLPFDALYIPSTPRDEIFLPSGSSRTARSIALPPDRRG
jgi:hypothetical protein